MSVIDLDYVFLSLSVVSRVGLLQSVVPDPVFIVLRTLAVESSGLPGQVALPKRDSQINIKPEPPAEPFDSSSFDHYHWHMELLPRVAMLAGFEYGTGDYINTVFPDTAAATLRENLRSGITS